MCTLMESTTHAVRASRAAAWVPEVHADGAVLAYIHVVECSRAHLVHCSTMSTSTAASRGRGGARVSPAHEKIVVTEDMKQSFRERGYATTLGAVVGDHELERMRACYDDLYDSHSYSDGQDKHSGLVQIFGAAQLAPDLISHELFERANHAAVELLAALDGVHPAYHSSTPQLQTRTSVHTMGCICKPALTSEFTEFHQDEAYSPADIERWGVTAQLTLQPNDEQSGQVPISAGACTSRPATCCGSLCRALWSNLIILAVAWTGVCALSQALTNYQCWSTWLLPTRHSTQSTVHISMSCNSRPRPRTQ